MKKKQHTITHHQISIFSHAGRFLTNHSILIAIILGLLLLIYSVYTIQAIFDLPSDEDYKQSQINKNNIKSFDKDTMEQVEQLHTSQDGPIPLPDGKINPFSE